MSTQADRTVHPALGSFTQPQPGMRFNCGTLNENWYIAARSAEVKRRPLTRTVMEENLVLWRDGSGRLTAQLDRCLHRNAALSAGVVANDCIRCPYHGWAYGTDGTCVDVPSEGPGEPKVARRLETFPVTEQDDFVWVYMGAPEGAVDRRPFAFPKVESGWASYVMTTDFEGDVTDLVENFMDVPHTAFVHRGWFRKGMQSKQVTATVERTASSVEVTYHRPDDVIAFARALLNPEGLSMTHTDRFFMPNCTRVDYRWGDKRHFVITSQITPVTPERATVYTAITFTLGRATKAARVLLPSYTRAVINQDVKIMANQTRNIRRFGGRRFSGTSADVIHRHIEALRAHALAGGREPKPVAQSRDVTFWI